MPLNPFLRTLPSTRPSISPPTSSVAPSNSADSRSQALRMIAQDVHARTARIERLRAVGKLAHDDLKATQHVGSSRIAWLAQQLNHGNSLKAQDL